MSVIFTHKFALSQEDVEISVAYNELPGKITVKEFHETVPQVSDEQAVVEEDSPEKTKSKAPEFSAGTVMKLQCLESALSRKEIKVFKNLI